MLDDVHGQPEGVRFLRRFVVDKLSVPLLMVGGEGIGRRFSVVQATKERFCTAGHPPQCTCIDCLYIDQGTHPDLIRVGPEDADKDIKVEAIRDLIAEACNYPSMGPVRVLLVDGADRMTAAAANALLKTLEEPPSTIRFFLLAESYDRVLPTIRSRCGRVAYRPLPEDFVVSVLQRYEDDHAKALVLARLSEGSVGRAIQYWGAGRLGLRDRVLTLVQLWLNGDWCSLFSAIDGIVADLPLALKFLEHLLYDVLMSTHDPTKLTNQDLLEGVAGLRQAASLQAWVRLSSDLRIVRERGLRSRVHLPFHVKALFAGSIGV